LCAQIAENATNVAFAADATAPCVFGTVLPLQGRGATTGRASFSNRHGVAAYG
jgi:hypothetical protein